MTATIHRIHNVEHEARAVAAIRARWDAEGREAVRVLPWYRQRDERGKFRAREAAA